MFGDRLRDQGEDARTRRQNDEEPSAEKSGFGAAPDQQQGARRQQHEQQDLRKHLRRMPDKVRAIIADERLRPEREAKIERNGTALGQEIMPRGDAEPK